MKVRNLRDVLKDFEHLYSESNRRSEARVLRQLFLFLEDHDSKTTSNLVAKIRASRSSGRG